jgi:hypothetical protein
VLNGKSVLDSSAIDALSLVANLTERIRTGGGPAPTSSGGAAESPAERAADADALAAEMPELVWVLRDAFLEMVDADGRALSGREYLELALKPAVVRARASARARPFPRLGCTAAAEPRARPFPHPPARTRTFSPFPFPTPPGRSRRPPSARRAPSAQGGGAAAAERNETRAAITRLFRRRSLFALPNPTATTTIDARKLSAVGSLAELNPAFGTALGELRAHLLGGARPKAIGGAPVSAAAYVELVRLCARGVGALRGCRPARGFCVVPCVCVGVC